MNHPNVNRECPELLETVNANLYVSNPFRTLGVPVTAGFGDIRRVQQRLEMRVRLGIQEEAQDGPAPPESGVSPEVIRTAMERIGSPRQRLVDEIFCFWPMNGAKVDPALDAVAAGNMEEATAFWLKLSNQGEHGIIGTHNLAVTYHMRALELEGRSGRNGELKGVDKLWQKALECWAEVCNSDLFWNAVWERAGAIGDQKLTTGYVRRIREGLPAALLSVNAGILHAAASAGDDRHCRLHTKLMHAARLGDSTAEEAVRIALRPLRSRLAQMIENAKSSWTETPQHGLRIVRDLHAQAGPILGTLDRMLPADDIVRAGLHDLVAEAVMMGEFAFIERTNDWPAGAEVLRLARETAIGRELRERLNSEIATRGENVKLANDWCAPGYWSLPPETIAILERIRARADASDFDAAILELSALDLGIGHPLRRCMAYCLSLKAVHLANEAVDDITEETPVLKKIMSKISGNPDTAAALLCPPDPYSYYTPPCPSCGRSSYTEWITMEHKGIPVFMCSGCASRHNAEIDRRRSGLSRALKEPMRYMLLAVEVDPKDPGIRRNLGTLVEMTGDPDCRAQSTESLKRSLTERPMRGLEMPADQPECTTCFFCGGSPAGDDCGIDVPMCGDAKQVMTIFGGSLTYRHTSLRVPRCGECRDRHLAHSGEMKAWQKKRGKVSSGKNHPKQVEGVGEAEKGLLSARRMREEREQQLLSANEELKTAGALGTRCTRCGAGADDGWVENVCRRCDGHLFGVGRPAAALVGCVGGLVPALGAYALGSGAFGAGIALGPGASWILLAPFALTAFPALRVYLSARRRRATARAGISAQREAFYARESADRVQAAERRIRDLKQAVEKLRCGEQEREEALAKARTVLETAVRQGIADFERRCPSPLAGSGIRPEEDFAEYPAIREYRRRGWGFGSEPVGAVA